MRHIGIGAFALWTSAELYHAYKSIKTNDWEKAGYLRPVLLATRTAKNMFSRPAQILDILEKKVIAQKNNISDIDHFYQLNKIEN